MRRTRPNLIQRPAPPLEPRESVADQLARVEPGTRVRIFHSEGDRRAATSGTVVILRDACLTVAPLGGGEPLRVPIDRITCMYLPEDLAAES
jgi:hypothetical protein